MVNATTYLYDTNEQRVQKTVGGKVTRYPSQNYETLGTSTTKHIYANGTLVSTVEGVGSTSASIFHNHQDHLGSTARHVLTRNKMKKLQHLLELFHFVAEIVRNWNQIREDMTNMSNVFK